MMMKYCAYCGGYHKPGYICDKRPRYGKQKNNKINKFRHGNAWREKSKDIRARDKYLCVYCLKHDHVINNADIEVHHIVSISEDFDLRLEDSNLISLCRNHHEDAESGIINKEELINMIDLKENL